MYIVTLWINIKSMKMTLSPLCQILILPAGVWCRVMREADANKLKLTPQFLELKFIEAIANNSKMFFGEKVRLHFPT